MGKYYTPFSREELLPQEETLELEKKEGNLSIGIPLESNLQEKRVCLTPDAVEVLVANGHKVTIEASAGLGAHFSNNQYAEAGACVVYEKETVFKQPIILKVNPPTLEEIDLLNEQSILISTLIPSMLESSYFEKLAQKKITALGMEYLQDEHQTRPLQRLIQEINGNAAILVAGELLSTVNGGNGVLLGGVTGVRPTEVVIIGAGISGECAARAAMSMGAGVRVFDASITRLRNLQNHLNFRVPTSILDPKELKKALRRCDVAIGALSEEGRTPTVVTEEMVTHMKEGAIIIDMSIAGGGCFETSEITTHQSPYTVKHGVIHYGVANISSRYARTASKAMSNFFLSYLIQVAKDGGFDRMVQTHKGIRCGIYLYKGKHTHQKLAEWFNLKYTDLNLILF